MGTPAVVARVPFDLVDDGDVPLTAVTSGSVARRSGPLDTDRVNGLQLRIQSCSQDWTATAGGCTCAGDVTDSYAGPSVVRQPLRGVAGLAPGGVEHLLATTTFPTTAGDELRERSSALTSTVTVTATQRDGAAR